MNCPSKPQEGLRGETGRKPGSESGLVLGFACTGRSPRAGDAVGTSLLPGRRGDSEPFLPPLALRAEAGETRLSRRQSGPAAPVRIPRKLFYLDPGSGLAGLLHTKLVCKNSPSCQRLALYAEAKTVLGSRPDGARVRGAQFLTKYCSCAVDPLEMGSMFISRWFRLRQLIRKKEGERRGDRTLQRLLEGVT